MALRHTAVSLVAGREESLPAELLSRHPDLLGVRVRRGGILPRLGGWCLGAASVAGITFGRTIWFGAATRLSEELLLHELRHVHQFQAVRAFPLRYAWETLRRGYHHNCYEVEARQFARARMGNGPDPTLSEGV